MENLPARQRDSTGRDDGPDPSRAGHAARRRTPNRGRHVDRRPGLPRHRPARPVGGLRRYGRRCVDSVRLRGWAGAPGARGRGGGRRRRLRPAAADPLGDAESGLPRHRGHRRRPLAGLHAARPRAVAGNNPGVPRHAGAGRSRRHGGDPRRRQPRRYRRQCRCGYRGGHRRRPGVDPGSPRRLRRSPVRPAGVCRGVAEPGQRSRGAAGAAAPARPHGGQHASERR